MNNNIDVKTSTVIIILLTLTVLILYVNIIKLTNKELKKLNLRKKVKNWKINDVKQK